MIPSIRGDPHEPYYGYYFKILKAQGRIANGGAIDYVANGKMVLGFPLVAFPPNAALQVS